MNLNLNILLPLASQWVELKEKEILGNGHALSSELTAFALKIGIKHPERIKILEVDRISPPEHPLLKQACDATQMISRNTAGLTLRYGIFIKKDFVSHASLYKHELAHVLQYEQLGGIKEFLNKYLNEVLAYGYPNAPMEKEAREKENL